MQVQVKLQVQVQVKVQVQVQLQVKVQVQVQVQMQVRCRCRCGAGAGPGEGTGVQIEVQVEGQVRISRSIVFVYMYCTVCFITVWRPPTRPNSFRRVAGQIPHYFLIKRTPPVEPNILHGVAAFRGDITRATVQTVLNLGLRMPEGRHMDMARSYCMVDV